MEGFGLVTREKTHHYTTLNIILYAKNTQNTISQTALKNYNQFRNVRTEALIAKYARNGNP